ncbi:hypothetical protein L7F22_033394 [Adiantum nelumboides]|nr:hypothetical protein [Adiantum nelumboides]
MPDIDSMLLDQAVPSKGAFGDSFGVDFNPDITLFVHGQPIEAHRALLVARSSYFKAKFDKDWKNKKEVRLSNQKLTFPALFSLIQFFYTDRLDVAVEDMEDLARICKVCGCAGLHKAVERELLHQRFAEYKHLRDADDSQRRFILQGSSLPEEERLPHAMRELFDLTRTNASRYAPRHKNGLYAYSSEIKSNISTDVKDSKVSESHTVVLHCSKASNKILFRENYDDAADMNHSSAHNDHADVCFIVEEEVFRSHQVILAARSDYFRTRFSRMKGFRESKLEMVETDSGPLPALQENDLSAETFEKLLEYIYTDQVSRLEPNQAEELFDAASRYLLFPLKKVVADALLPHLETATPVKLCHWLLAADMYVVWKLREYCLDTMAANFEVFIETREFRQMLSRLPPPSGDSCLRTSAPSAPGGEGKANQGNILDDLREKWLEAEGAELDKRDESAIQFDKILETLVLAAENESDCEIDDSFGSHLSKLDVRERS